MNDHSIIEQLREEFRQSRMVLTALGDETRQHLFLMLLGSDKGGARVVDIAKQTNLSRPAVSHHIQILKEAQIVRCRKEGTKIYYYIEPSDNEIEKLITLFKDITNHINSL